MRIILGDPVSDALVDSQVQLLILDQIGYRARELVRRCLYYEMMNALIVGISQLVTPHRRPKQETT